MTAEPSTIALPADAACLGCGYSLQQLTVARCPECGRAFDPGDVMSTANVQRAVLLRRRYSAWPVVMFGMIASIAASLLVTFIFPLRDQRIPAALVAIGLAFWARSFTRQQIIHTHLTRSDHRDRAVSKWLAVGLVVVGLATSTQTNVCCHGSLVVVGPIAVTRTGREGMCRNYLRLGDRHAISESLSWYWARSL